MRNSRSNIVFPLVCFLYSTISILSGPNALGCNEEERHALLRFREALTDPCNRLSSWSIDQDCCRWESVRCSNVTGRVVGLHLGNPYDTDDEKLYRKFALGGEIGAALLDLEFLSYLNLSGNNFGGRPIPDFLASMRSLRNLDLSYASFGGLIPHHLGNLSSLRRLDLRYNSGLYVENLDWISHLSSLEYLDMGTVDLSKAANWLESVSMSPSLSELHLSGCRLHKIAFSPLGYVNLSSLTFLDLSSNHFNQEMPDWLFNFSTSLSYLDLSQNGLKGQISESIGQLKYLEFLAFCDNSFHGPIPTSIGNLSSLRKLYLWDNRLINGTLPVTLGLLSNLEVLVIGGDSLTGTISEAHFTALSKLKTLAIGNTPLSFRVSSTWTPPFQLASLAVSSCKMGPKFPAWLQTQKSLNFLKLSGCGIRDAAPNWFWEWISNLIILSNNQISGDLSHAILNTTIIDLSSNSFTGLLPRLSPHVVLFNIHNNSCSGQISRLLCQNVNGTSKLEVLDISNNYLSGELSDCWNHWPSLTHIDLGSNRMSGTIPDSMGSLVGLRELKLLNNSFDGQIPPSVEKCKDLMLLDLSHNKFSGTIPGWIFERITLRIINLRSNEFMGNIPPRICHLSHLRVLDLADNILSGTIPKCLNNISAMAEGPSTTPNDLYGALLILEATAFVFYLPSQEFHTKGRFLTYEENLEYVKHIDLSCNNFSGSIPDEIFSLTGLQFLNLSHNHLTGILSEKIGGMKWLESLDLSRNHLSGEIPPTMAYLTYLSTLNISYNNLSGRIPSSTQLQSLDPLSFVGNAELCGPPLTTNCTADEETPAHTAAQVEENRGFSETAWFCIGVALGFIVGFWGVCGTLIVQREWRRAYFQFVEDMNDWLYVRTAIILKWFRHKFTRRFPG